MNENKEFDIQQINVMLQYQDIDRQLQDLINQIKHSDEAAIYNKAKEERKRASEEVVRINTLTEEIYKQVDKVMNDYKEVKAQIDDISSYLENDNAEIEESEYYIKQLEKFDAKIEDIQNNMDQLISELNHKRVEYKSEVEAATKAFNLMNKYKEAVVKLRNEKQAEANALQSKLKEIRKNIKDDALFNEYEDVKSRVKNRVLVPYINEHKVCGGCGVEVTIEVKSAFEEGAVKYECPNCGRIIYNIDKE